MSTHQLLKIQSINRLTPSAVAISFEIPSSLSTDFSFKAGQYLSLEATIKDEVVRRSYSLCSAPHEEALIVGIKKIENGIFSSFANDELSVGDQLAVALPEGRFVYSPNRENEEILLIAAGSGITPVFSILKSMLKEESGTNIHLIYGNKTPEEAMFKAKIEDLEATHSNRFKVHWVYSQSNESSALFGRIDQSIINYALNQTNRLPDQVFLCGPKDMIETVKDHLIERKVEANNIHFELFTPSIAETPKGEKSKDQILLSITTDGEEHQVETTGEKTLLDVALQQKIDVPYSCQGGVCCSCIAKIKAGSASMENNQILTDDEIKEGLVLTCQAFPTSNIIKIDYDDV